MVLVLETLLPQGQPRNLRVWFLLTIALMGTAVFVFLNIGYWLIAEDPLEKASAIAVLSGRMPDRALEAARIYNHGYAPEVWLTHSTEPGATLAKEGVTYVGEEMYDKLLLMNQGVPESAIRVLDPPILNTAEEIRTIGKALREEERRRVIIVTSKVHTRRARTQWKHLCGSEGTAIVRGVSYDSYDPAGWWKNTRDALDVVREVLGLLNAWAGLPLQPAR